MKTLSRLIAITAILINSHCTLAQSDTGVLLKAGKVLAKVVKGQLYIVDPYLATDYNPLPGYQTSFDQSDLISDLTDYSQIKVKGMITDGIATAIAIYSIDEDVPVKFTGTDGTTFSPWNKNFLYSAPGTGQSSLQVQPVQIPGRSTYYSFALVQSPQQGKSVNYGKQLASVTASISTDLGDYSSDPAKFDMEPTPVIFVHGLWGGSASLTTVQSTLQGQVPWALANSQYGPLSPICYSKYLPFDAASELDSLMSKDSSGCENTSHDAIGERLTEIEQALDLMQYVGGRYDLVVHSMGGLAARHYTTDPNYITPRNLMQGSFRTLVTIDTPTNGSALPEFLLNPSVAGGTCSYTRHGLCNGPIGELATPGKIWASVCFTRDLASCLGGVPIGNPLGPPGDGPGGFNISVCPAAGSTECGAVASLATGSPNIMALPSPKIPNTKWFALGADWEDNGTSSKPSMLRAFLDNLMAAMALPGSPATTKIHRTPNNDVIVTTASQFWDTSGVPIVEFPYLAHTAIPIVGKLGELMSGTSNASVTTSATVANCVAIILFSLTTSGCNVSAGPGTDASANNPATTIQESSSTVGTAKETEAERIERESHPLKLVPERMSVKVPTGDVSLGNPVDLTLTLAAGKIVGPVSVIQRSLYETQALGSGDAKVVSEQGSNKTIQIIPVQTGPLDVEISVLYLDNALVRQTIHLNAVPSARGLKSFSLYNGLVGLKLKLDGRKSEQQIWLRPTVTYEGLPQTLYLENSSQIGLSVEQDATNPVIKVDTNGLVHAIREGKAVIVGDFDGVKDRIAVTVWSTEIPRPK